MRHRIEDLGRIAVLLQDLLKQEMFNDINRPNRPKDCLDWWSKFDKDKQSEMLYTWSYGIQNIEHAIYEIMSVAEGTDNLNQMENNKWN